jgi:hypothetical protein
MSTVLRDEPIRGRSMPARDEPRASFALTGRSKLVGAFDLLLACLAGWLLWRSLSWPLVGDAAIFHFIANQMAMGAVPYRDIIDVNMPLTYDIHAAVVALFGMSDAGWRIFDLAAAALLSVCILALVWPAGRAQAILAVLAVLLMHLLLGRYAAGQRDFLMAIPALAAAWASAKAAEDPRRWRILLALAGVFAMTAALIKPSGIVLLALPALTMRLRWRHLIWIAAGAAAVALAVFGALAARGGLGPFVAMVRDVLPAYAAMGAQPPLEVLKAVHWIGPVAGLAVAAALGLGIAKPPRLRAIIGLAVFGLFHLMVQRKGWLYHVYPLGVGLACWGAWAVAALPARRVLLSLAVMAGVLGWSVPRSMSQDENDPALRSSSAMQAALERRLPRGARVQVLDSDSGAFRAMARTGMRQATPHIQWLSLLLAPESVRQDFLAALEAEPPDAFLLTNNQWPRESGFEAADDWPEFAGLLKSHYDLVETKQDEFIAWRLYVRRRPKA